MITEAIQSILTDRDIKQALVDYIRADIKSADDGWREVWYQKGKESRKIPPDPNMLGTMARTVTMLLTANWNESKRVGVLEGFITEVDDHHWSGMWTRYVFRHESVTADHYTEVIEEAQEAWGRFWVEFNAYLDKEEAKQKAQAVS